MQSASLPSLGLPGKDTMLRRQRISAVAMAFDSWHLPLEGAVKAIALFVLKKVEL